MFLFLFKSIALLSFILLAFWPNGNGYSCSFGFRLFFLGMSLAVLGTFFRAHLA